jgi:hypothetical protein
VRSIDGIRKRSRLRRISSTILLLGHKLGVESRESIPQNLLNSAGTAFHTIDIRSLYKGIDKSFKICKINRKIGKI